MGLSNLFGSHCPKQESILKMAMYFCYLRYAVRPSSSLIYVMTEWESALDLGVDWWGTGKNITEFVKDRLKIYVYMTKKSENHLDWRNKIHL